MTGAQVVVFGVAAGTCRPACRAGGQTYDDLTADMSGGGTVEKGSQEVLDGPLPDLRQLPANSCAYLDLARRE